MSRGYSPKRRDSHLRSRVPIFVFALEGDNKTEYNYLKQMAREYKGRITFRYADGNKTDPVAMMEALIKKAKELDLIESDRGFSLVDSDCDPSKNKLMKEADERAHALDIGIIRQIVSSPCFELWFLLHFEYTTAQYGKSNEVVIRLREKMNDYYKGKPNMYELLKKDQQKACERARKLMDHCKNNGAKLHTTGFMPSTEVYIIFESISNILAKGVTTCL